VEFPQGNYGAPYAMFGWSPYAIKNSKVIGCYAIGNPGGLSWSNPTIGFNSGGVNFADVKDCQIDSNIFIDWEGAAYTDTGSCDGVQITNNTVIRGQYGVGLNNSTMPKQNIKIIGNSFLIQNHWLNGPSYGVVAAYARTTNVTITNNAINFDSSGAGQLSFWGVAMELVTNATISNNTIGFASCAVNNAATGDGLIMSNNLDPNGNPVSGL
jgi:hypothetical protein